MDRKQRKIQAIEEMEAILTRYASVRNEVVGFRDWTKDEAFILKMERFKKALVIEFCLCGHQKRHHSPQCDRCAHCKAFEYSIDESSRQHSMLRRALFESDDKPDGRLF
jgi:hypothetical protein